MAPRKGFDPSTAVRQTAVIATSPPELMKVVLAGRAGFEPAPLVLETSVLPLHYRPVLVRVARFERALTAIPSRDVDQATPHPVVAQA